MFGGIGDLFCVLRGNERIFEKSGDELGLQDPRDGAIYRRFGYFALIHLIDQAGESGSEWQFDIDSGFERKLRSRFIRVDYVMDGAQFGDSEVVRDYQASVSPFVAKNSVEK